jgi:hypothetical protein
LVGILSKLPDLCDLKIAANEPSGEESDELMTGTTSKAAAIYGTQKVRERGGRCD